MFSSIQCLPQEDIDNLEYIQRQAEKKSLTTITCEEQLKKLRMFDFKTQHATRMNDLHVKFNLFDEVPESRNKCWNSQGSSFVFDQKECSNNKYYLKIKWISLKSK